MTRMNRNDTDCVDDDDEEYRIEFLPQITSSMDNNLWAYHNHEHEFFPHYHRTPPDTTFPRNPSAHDTFACRRTTFALPPQQFSHLLQPGFSQSLSASQYFPQGHVNVRHFLPFYGISEPQMMISRGLDYTTTRSVPHRMDSEMPTPIYSSGSISPTASSPSLSFMSSPEKCYPYTAWLPALPGSPHEENLISLGEDTNEDDCPFDKPYAQLIYDALMKAPGHRMLLRDIYEWFVQNTKKPRESGTNGWQNSIRHNLSMNQAFENDKNDPAASRGARKANSMWVLTEHAIKHGVQSTTRYRKNNSSKKVAVNKAPAVKRQRSGARGGRATRRAARSKRTSDDLGEEHISQPRPSHHISLDTINHGAPQCRDLWIPYDAYSPHTPQADHFFDQTYNLSNSLHYPTCEGDVKYEADPFEDSDDQLRRILSQASSEDVFEDTMRFG